MTIPYSVLQELRAVVGSGGFVDTPADMEPYVVDHRHLYRGATPLVLMPHDTTQVASILRICHQHTIGVVPIAGNTSYCGGATPSTDGSQVMVSLRRMRRIRSLDPLNFALTAEAGCLLLEVQEAAASVDRLFPLSLGSEGSCQLGGNLSTNAGGTAVLRYGMARDLILGLEVVLADGRVLNQLSGLRKDNTGYDLVDLFIGAEGTLGIITAATCKLFPRPRTLLTALVAIKDPQAAVDLLAQLRSATGDAISTFELIPRIGLDLVLRHIARVSDPFDKRYEWYVLVEIGAAGSEDTLRAQLESELMCAVEKTLALDAVIAQSEAQREMLWRIRETIPEAQRHEGHSIKHDVAVTTSELPKFLHEATHAALAVAPTARVVAYGHLGDGNLHFNLSAPENGDVAAFKQATATINRVIHDLVARYQGSISAEHGIGQLKREELKRYKDPVALDLMHAIKQAIDPKGIMNPGKVL